MLEELLDLIQTLTERIRKHHSTLGKRETRTRMALVDPVLQALEWDTTNPEVVVGEYEIDSDRPDYALLRDDAKPSAIIEAKKLGDSLDRHVKQMLNYANAGGIPYAGITDGNHWRLYKVFEQRPIEERCIVQVELVAMPPLKSAMSLLTLWRPNLSSGAPVGASAAHQHSDVHTAVGTERDASAAPLLPTPEQLVPIVERATTTLADFHPEPSQPWPTAILLPGDLSERQISNQKDLLKAVAKGLISLGKLRANQNGTLASGSKLYIVHTSPIHRNGDPFRSRVDLGGGLYLETSNAGPQTVEYAIKLLEHCGLAARDVKLTWDNEPKERERERPKEWAARVAKTVSELKDDNLWTKKVLLDEVLGLGLRTETGKDLTKDSSWYQRLAQKGRRGIIDMLARDYPNEFIGHFEDDE